MPGKKCEASRLPEGRSRKQTRQELQEGDEQCRGQRADEQRRERSRPAGLPRRVQILRRQRHGRQAVRHRARAAALRVTAAAARRRARGRRGRRAADRSRAAPAGDGPFAPPAGPARRSARMRADRCAAAVSMRRWPRCRALRRRRGLAAGHVRARRNDRLGDRRHRLGLDGCHAGRSRRGNGTGRGRRGDRCRDRGDGRGARRGLLRSERLSIGHGGAGFLQQLRGAVGIRGARCRRNGEDAERDRADQNADAHPGMIRAAAPRRHRPPRGSRSPRSGGFYDAFLRVDGSSRPRRFASTAASTRLSTSSFRIALLRYSFTVCRLR